jgi:RNA polymerase sigma-70 factor (ECF subfamily)
MEPDSSFAAWMARVRAGDAEAAEELVRRHERAVRVAVRLRLTDPRLRRHFDSMDVCQSVLASFFVRAAAGQFDLQNPQQLVGLLVKMARNKLLMQVRKHGQQKRDVGRVEAGGDDAPPVADAAPGPVRRAAARELLSHLLKCLGPEERELAQRRALGQGWQEIAADLGETPQAVRMRLSRAIDRVSPALGVDDGLEFDD